VALSALIEHNSEHKFLAEAFVGIDEEDQAIWQKLNVRRRSQNLKKH
jgi:hypothetical protein